MVARPCDITKRKKYILLKMERRERKSGQGMNKVNELSCKSY